MTDVRTLRPGLLVSLKTSIGGNNVQYERRDLENQHVTEEGQERSAWETTRTVLDPAEFAAASKVRGQVRYLVAKVCTQSGFGLLCPNDREDELKAAVVQSRQMAWEFNQTAKNTQVWVNVIYGRVAQDDVEAVAAISMELRELVATIDAGVETLDVTKIRDAAQKMRNTGQMLSTDVKLKVDDIVKAARQAAKKISAAGEEAATEIDKETLERLRGARTAFLDMDLQGTDDTTTDDGDVAAELRAANTRAVDFSAWDEDAADDAPAVAAAPARPVLDMDDADLVDATTGTEA